jgi:DNA-directed RNA polymerase subunit RPC12/RpoP
MDSEPDPLYVQVEPILEQFRNLTSKDRTASRTIMAVACGLLLAVAVYAGQNHPLWFVGAAVVVLAALVVWHSRAFGYRCDSCGIEFSATPWQDFLAPHHEEKKYLRCPRCGRKEWARIIARGRGK